MKTDKDTRQKLEEDARAVIMGGYVSVDDVRGWLDRQAAITRAEMCGCPGYDADRHYCKYHANDFELTREQVCELKREVSRLERERDELQAKLDAYDETHIALPLDADGIPIRVGDLIEFGEKGERLEVTHFGWTKHGDPTIAYRRPNGTLDCSCIGDGCRHVTPRTIEDVLTDLCNEVAVQGHLIGLTGHEIVMKYADELRELMEVGA